MGEIRSYNSACKFNVGIIQQLRLVEIPTYIVILFHEKVICFCMYFRMEIL